MPQPAPADKRKLCLAPGAYTWRSPLTLFVLIECIPAPKGRFRRNSVDRLVKSEISGRSRLKAFRFLRIRNGRTGVGPAIFLSPSVAPPPLDPLRRGCSYRRTSAQQAPVAAIFLSPNAPVNSAGRFKSQCEPTPLNESPASGLAPRVSVLRECSKSVKERTRRRPPPLLPPTPRNPGAPRERLEPPI